MGGFAPPQGAGGLGAVEVSGGLTGAGTVGSPLALHSRLEARVAGVAFAAHRSAATQNVNSQTFTPVVFDTELSDLGSCYNHTNGRFTAPATGLYSFHAGFAWTSAVAAGGALIGLLVDGSQIEATQHWQTTRGGDVVTVGATIYLTADQYVEVVAYTTQGGTPANTIANYGRGYVFFSGHGPH